MLSLLAVVPLLQSPPAPLTAADFFPLSPGCTRTFVEPAGVTTEEVQEPIRVGGQTVYPVVQRAEGRTLDTKFYKIDAGKVFLLGYDDQKNWLSEPMPVLQYDGHPGKWKYEGTTGGSTPQAISLVGESRIVRDETIMGKTVSVLQVSLRSTLGSGQTQEIDTSVAKYAAGIGMIEVTSSVEAARQRSHSVVRRLVKIEGGKSNG